jgi:hypothetical protein
MELLNQLAKNTNAILHVTSRTRRPLRIAESEQMQGAVDGCVSHTAEHT